MSLKTPIKNSTLSNIKSSDSRISQKRILRPPYFKPSPFPKNPDDHQTEEPIRTIKNQKIYERFNKYRPENEQDISKTSSSSVKEFHLSINQNNLHVIDDKDDQISITYFDETNSDSEDPSIILASDAQNEHFQIPPNSPIFNVKTSFVRENKVETNPNDQIQVEALPSSTNQKSSSPRKKAKSTKKSQKSIDFQNKAHVTFSLPHDYERKQTMNFDFLKDLEEEETIEEDPRILSPKIPPLCKRLSDPTDFYICPRRSEKSEKPSPKEKSRPNFSPYGNLPVSSPKKKPNISYPNEIKHINKQNHTPSENKSKQSENDENDQESKFSMIENESISEFLRVERNLLRQTSKRNFDINYLKVLQIVRSRLQRTPEFPVISKLLMNNQSKHFLLLLSHPCLQLDGIYVTFESEAKKIYGIGPQMFTARQVDTFWQYNVNSQRFDIVMTKNFNCDDI